MSDDVQLQALFETIKQQWKASVESQLQVCRLLQASKVNHD